MRGVCHSSTKLVAMATSLEISEKEVQVDHLHSKHFHSVKKIAKISPVDHEIIVIRAIIKKRKKLTHAKYIALPASLPSRLNK